MQAGEESILMTVLNGSKQTFTTASSSLQQCASKVREAFVAAVFGEKPDGYVPKAATFNRERPRLPVGTMSFAKDGTTVTGLYDCGAQISVLSTRAAKAQGLFPFDGARTAVAANGQQMQCHGMAHSVETYHDGFCLGRSVLQEAGEAQDFLTVAAPEPSLVLPLGGT